MNKLFGKYEYNVEVRDPVLKQVIAFPALTIPHSFARHAGHPFAKTKVNLVERLANKLMRGGTGEKLGGKIIRTHGRLQGKKTKVLRIIEEAFDDLHKRTGQNPLQVLVRAVENSAPREDTTRVRFGGVSYQLSVDISPSRRLDMTLRHLALAAIMGSFGGKAPMAKALADELELAAKADQNSYGVRKRNDTERMARSSR